VLGAALAYANGGSVAGGALAGGGGELAAQVLTKELYPQAFNSDGVLQRDKLTQEQANNVTALSSAIGALLSGAAGGSTHDAAIGGQVATNAVENNFLKRSEAAAMSKEFSECKQKKGGCSDADYLEIRNKYLKMSSANIAQVESCVFSGNVRCVQMLEAQAASASDISRDLVSKDAIVFTGRQDNVTYYGSVKGSASLFGKDVEQAAENAQFRQENCAGISASACDSMLKDAQVYRLARAGLLGLVTRAVPLVAKGARSRISGMKSSTTTKPGEKLVPGETKVVGDGKVAANDSIYGRNASVGSAASAGEIENSVKASGEGKYAQQYGKTYSGESYSDRNGKSLATDKLPNGFELADASTKNGLGGTVAIDDVGMKFGKGIMGQGKPFEAYVQSKLPEGTIDLNTIKSNFSTFDHLTPEGVAVSDKTLDTNASTYTSKPRAITSLLNGYVDKMVDFAGDGKRGMFELKPSDISAKEMQLAIPASASTEQLTAIANSVKYAESKGIKITVTKIK